MRMILVDKIPADAPALTDRPRSDYPLSGRKTGPAWRAAWDVLREGYAVKGHHEPSSEVARAVVERVPDVSPDTVKNLLSSAHRHGVLAKVHVLHNSRTQAAYRIRDEWIKALY